MSLTPFLNLLFAFAVFCLLFGVLHGARARSHWRSGRRLAAGHRSLWSLVFVLLALLGAFGGVTLLGYRRLASEELVALLDTHAIGPQHYAVAIEWPDGTRRDYELAGDEWQLDARVIKWQARAVVLGAPPLYRLDRLSGRYHDVEQERAQPKSAIALDDSVVPDLWTLKRRVPEWLPWIDADYGSAAFLPLVDGGRYTVSLAASGGLVARPADDATRERIKATGW